jgi:hypothetical protein
VIVPSPECRVLHLELHGLAQALAGDNRAARESPGFHRMRASLEQSESVGQTLRPLGSIVLPSYMPIELDFLSPKWRARMRKLALTILTVSLLSGPTAADNPQCPAGYELVGRLCHDSSTGDVVLPDRAIVLPNGDIELPNN